MAAFLFKTILAIGNQRSTCVLPMLNLLLMSIIVNMFMQYRLSPVAR